MPSPSWHRCPTAAGPCGGFITIAPVVSGPTAQGEGEECPAWQGANFEGAFSEHEQNTQQAHRQQRAALSFLPSLPPPPNPRGFLVPGCSVLLESGKPTSPHPGSGRIREVLQNFLHEDLNRCQRPTLTRNDSRDILEQNNLKKKKKPIKPDHTWR